MSGKVKVLVVEDEGITALDIKQSLQHLGYEVLGTCDTGESAVEQALQLKPDVVLMDIMLKGQMDGITAAAKIRSVREVPVVFLTAFADEGTLSRAKHVDPYGYVLKPFEEAELRTAIDLGLHRFEREGHVIGEAVENGFGGQPLAELPGDGRGGKYTPFDFLKKVEPFTSIPEGALRSLADACRFASVEAGEYLSYEGDIDASSFIVTSGRVAMVKTSVSGRELIVELMSPGDLFGLITQFEKVPATLSARAQIDTEVLWVPKATLALVLDDYPEIYKKFVEKISARLRRSHEVSRGLAHDRVETRIAVALKSLVPSFARASTDTHVFTVDITRQEVADLTGTTPETAIRTTKAMERDGMLDLSRPGVIRILDLKRITEVAEGL
jgi:CRP-like cAMP-binding protein/ActR/RegA family two-component response regulator